MQIASLKSKDFNFNPFSMRKINNLNFGLKLTAPINNDLFKKNENVSSFPAKSYYAGNATRYCDQTRNNDLTEEYKFFLSHLPKSDKSKIKLIDLGSGSGRDALAFLKMGYDVTAVDGSPELAEEATRYVREQTGSDFKVKVKDFRNLQLNNEFDGMWICASLGVWACGNSIEPSRKKDLDLITNNISSALKPGGVLFFSLRAGYQTKRFDDGDGKEAFYYSKQDFTELTDYFEEKGLELLDSKTSKDDANGRDNFRWHNAVLRKK